MRIFIGLIITITGISSLILSTIWDRKLFPYKESERFYLEKTFTTTFDEGEYEIKIYVVDSRKYTRKSFVEGDYEFRINNFLLEEGHLSGKSKAYGSTSAKTWYPGYAFKKIKFRVNKLSEIKISIFNLKGLENPYWLVEYRKSPPMINSTFLVIISCIFIMSGIIILCYKIR